MKKVYSCSDHFQLSAFKTELDIADIRYLVKNEFSHGAVGEIPINESWPQLWVLNDEDQEEAKKLCLDLEKKLLQPLLTEWTCNFCGEVNVASFEVCWQCQALPATS